MPNKMKDFLPSAEVEKLEIILDLAERYEAGLISLPEARAQVAARVAKAYPYHVACLEQSVKSGGAGERGRVNMRTVMQLLEGCLDYSRPQLAAGHPLMCYYQENERMHKLLLMVEDLVQYPVIRNQWSGLYDELKRYPVHLVRKQNQLYPVLERKGFERPTAAMWNLDNIVRNELKESLQLLEAGNDDEFIAKQPVLIKHLRNLMEKEENVLYPTSAALISPEEFESMKEGDREIGFFVDTEAPEALSEGPRKPSNGVDEFVQDLQALLLKHGYSAGTQQELDVSTGKLTLEQINLIYRHLPVDISFVDENELVRFYSDTNHRIFPRSRNVIGRQVVNCHPRKSVQVVQEIIQKFRSGEQDKAEFWMNKPGLFIHIDYIAVRDAHGRFRGVLEMMQDCTHIRSLEGQQTLLTWNRPAPPAAASGTAGAESAARDT